MFDFPKTLADHTNSGNRDAESRKQTTAEISSIDYSYGWTTPAMRSPNMITPRMMRYQMKMVVLCVRR